MYADPKAPRICDLDNPQDWPYLRKRMRMTAYHEAGHFAARLFTELELSRVVALSIIPEYGSIGRMTHEKSLAKMLLPSYPPPLQRIQGRMLLLEKLAGAATETILDQSERGGSIFDYWDGEDGFYEEHPDFSEALRIAEIMAKPYMPVHRILKLADKWTLEMLGIPAVWNAIETVASILMIKGSIEENEISDLSDSLEVPSFYCLPKWKRRLYPKPGEMDEFIERE